MGNWRPRKGTTIIIGYGIIVSSGITTTSSARSVYFWSYGTNRNKQVTCVYWLHHEGHTDILTEGYVGVAEDLDTRYKAHVRMLEGDYHENIHLSRAYKKYGNLTCTVLVIGHEDYCYDVEKKLRPQRGIGWNVAIGGDKPPSRLGQISWNKGKNLTQEHTDKVTIGRKAGLMKKYGVEFPSQIPAVRKIKSEKQKAIMAKVKFITDGKINKRHAIDDPMPEGFWVGMTLSEAQRRGLEAGRQKKAN